MPSNSDSPSRSDLTAPRHHLTRFRSPDCVLPQHHLLNSSRCGKPLVEHAQGAGREKTGHLPRGVDIALGDSEFNRQGARALGFHTTGCSCRSFRIFARDLPRTPYWRRIGGRRSGTNIPLCRAFVSLRKQAHRRCVSLLPRDQRHFKPRSRLLLERYTAGATKFSQCCISSPLVSEVTKCIRRPCIRTPRFSRITTLRLFLWRKCHEASASHCRVVLQADNRSLLKPQKAGRRRGRGGCALPTHGLGGRWT